MRENLFIGSGNFCMRSVLHRNMSEQHSPNAHDRSIEDRVSYAAEGAPCILYDNAYLMTLDPQ